MVRRSKRSKKSMGNSEVRVHPARIFPARPNNELFDVDTENGYVLCDILLNDDVLTMIMSHLSPTDLVQCCRPVCKTWCNLVDTNVWKAKLNASPLGANEKVRNLPWHLLYLILHKNILYRNLILNPYGADGFKHWEIYENGGDRFKIESGNVGTEDELPFPSCFTTSFRPCSKFQRIDFHRIGAKAEIMDTLQPTINISEWYAGRWDCRAIYILKVNLLNSNEEIIDEFKTRVNCGGDYGSRWCQVNHKFENYGPGARYLMFSHTGMDDQFWAGHYGSKMTGAQVELTL